MTLDSIHAILGASGTSGALMSIHRLLENSAFRPEEIAGLVRAYEVAMRELSTIGPDCPPHELIAATVIEIAQTGERDEAVIIEKTVTRLRK